MRRPTQFDNNLLSLAYEKDLYAVPVVVTCNFSTANLSHLEDHDWLGRPENRVRLDFTDTAAAQVAAAR